MDERFKRSEFAIRLPTATICSSRSTPARSPTARSTTRRGWRCSTSGSSPATSDPQWLTLYLPESERALTDEAGVRAAISADLTLASGPLRDVDPLTRSDQIAAWIGIVLLFVCIIASTAIDRATDEIVLQGVSQAILLLGWVALWDPAARLVTEILPHFFNRRRFAEFADIDVRFSWG